MLHHLTYQQNIAASKRREFQKEKGKGIYCEGNEIEGTQEGRILESVEVLKGVKAWRIRDGNPERQEAKWI